jgi:hypothetical protein
MLRCFNRRGHKGGLVPATLTSIESTDKVPTSAKDMRPMPLLQPGTYQASMIPMVCRKLGLLAGVGRIRLEMPGSLGVFVH